MDRRLDEHKPATLQSCIYTRRKTTAPTKHNAHCCNNDSRSDRHKMNELPVSVARAIYDEPVALCCDWLRLRARNNLNM